MAVYIYFGYANNAKGTYLYLAVPVKTHTWENLECGLQHVQNDATLTIDVNTYTPVTVNKICEIPLLLQEIRQLSHSSTTRAKKLNKSWRWKGSWKYQLCVICLMKGPQHLQKRVLHTEPSSALPFNLKYPLLSIWLYSSCLHLLSYLSVTYILPLSFLQ